MLNMYVRESLTATTGFNMCVKLHVKLFLAQTVTAGHTEHVKQSFLPLLPAALSDKMLSSSLHKLVYCLFN